MKNTYLPLRGICGKAIQNNLCKGCSKLELEEFKGQDRIKELQKEKARIDSELDLDKQENMRNIEEDINEEEMER